MKVWICYLRHPSWEAHQWLCKPCALARRTARDGAGRLIWIEVKPLQTVDGACADCEIKRQAAPGYVTPAVAFVPTRPESRLLTRAELAKIDMPKPLPQSARRRAA